MDDMVNIGLLQEKNVHPRSFVALIISLSFMGCSTVQTVPQNACVCRTDKDKKDFEEKFEKNLQNIVLLFAKNEKGNAISAGTGFVYDKNGLIMTARHVVENPLVASIEVVFKRNNQLIIKKARWHFDSLHHDLSILRVDYKFETQVQMRTGAVVSGEDLYAIGFPLYRPIKKAEHLRVTKTFGKAFDYISMEDIIGGAKIREVMQVSTLFLAPGFSGSPVFDKNGLMTAVVVQNKYLREMGSAFAFSVQAKYCADVAKEREKLNLIFP